LACALRQNHHWSERSLDISEAVRSMLKMNFIDVFQIIFVGAPALGRELAVPIQINQRFS
jgi:hypothetical protein